MPVSKVEDGYAITPDFRFLRGMLAVWLAVYMLYVALGFFVGYRSAPPGGGAQLLFGLIAGGVVTLVLLVLVALEWRRPSTILINREGVAMRSRWRRKTLKWSDIERIRVFRKYVLFKSRAGGGVMGPFSKHNIVVHCHTFGVKAGEIRNAVSSLRPDAPFG